VVFRHSLDTVSIFEALPWAFRNSLLLNIRKCSAIY